MVINSKGFLNRFQVVKIPSVKEIYGRLGASAPVTSVPDGTPLMYERKNDVIDEVNRKASQASDPE